MKLVFAFRIGVLTLCSIMMGCVQNQEAVPIEYGTDQCAYCRMTISNPRFGAELITDKRRILMYDAAECMVNQLNKDPVPYSKLYAVPYNQPKKLLPVEDLRFLISPDFRSPMGADLTAYSDTTNLATRYHQDLISWEELLTSL